MASLNVLIVEDEPLIAMAMQMLVEDEGGTAIGPYSEVGAAVSAARDGARIDCALLDCNLGREACWPVADALAARGVPFAFTSGQAGKDILERFAGRPIFVKPVDDEKVKRFLREHIQR